MTPELLALFFVPSFEGQEKLDPDAYFISDLDALKYTFQLKGSSPLRPCAFVARIFEGNTVGVIRYAVSQKSARYMPPAGRCAKSASTTTLLPLSAMETSRADSTRCSNCWILLLLRKPMGRTGSKDLYISIETS